MNQARATKWVLGLSLLAPPALAQPKPAAPAPAQPAAPAQPKPGAPPAPARPAEQLEQMKVFIGTWKCTGKQHATPMFGPEHTFTGAASGKPEVEGFWQQFVYEEKKSKEHPGLKLVGLWGWDQGGKRFIRAAASNEGAWDSASSVGWNGDKMVWTGDLSGPFGRMPFRQTFTRKGEKDWTFRLELNPQGNWIPFTEVSCLRAGK